MLFCDFKLFLQKPHYTCVAFFKEGDFNTIINCGVSSAWYVQYTIALMVQVDIYWSSKCGDPRYLSFNA